MNGDEPMPEGGWGTRAAVAYALLGVLVAAGVVLRFKVFGQSLVGDELSTLWIVQDRNLGQVVDLVRSDAEISPPLHFVLAWLAAQAWSAPEAIRLPSLLAGIGLLPVMWLLGRELFDRRVAAVATAIAALAPILIYFSGNGRGYAIMLFFLALSTWAMLRGARTGQAGWWVLYGLASVGAMYSHYTGVFLLAAQFGWLIFAHPPARIRALIANVAAALLYLPWIGGLRADTDSPTTELLESLQGYGFEAKRTAVEQLLFWEISAGQWSLSGRVDVWLIVAGVLVCLVGVALAMRRGAVSARPGANLVLVLILVLATPVGSLIAGLVGTDTFGGRNLAAAWIGLPLLVGLGVRRAGLPGLAALALILTGLVTGSVRLADPERSEFRYSDAAAFIDENAGPDDAIVDVSHLTPVPLTPLDAYLDRSDRPEFRIHLPAGPPPFLPGAQVPDPQKQWRSAFRGDRRVFVVTLVGAEGLEGDGLVTGSETLKVPPGWNPERQEVVGGVYPITVTVFERSLRPDHE